jgi:signal transduction histidine kinase/CheY-like chemotaxis protein
MRDPGLLPARIHPEDRERALAARSGARHDGAPLAAEYRLVGPDGRVIWVHDEAIAIRDATGTAGYLQGILQDITERKRLEDQLRQSQRLEAVGKLAGGVAHDFNNVLSVITGYSEMLLQEAGQGERLRSRIQEVLKAAERAARLTRQLLAFSRKQVLQPQVLDLNAVVADMDKMLRRIIGEDVDLVTRLAPALSAVRADQGQVEQVLLNLAVNARDAMPQGGKLTIETADVELDEAYARQHVPTRPGRYVMLAVSDTGSGMDQEILSHIFEPFFTTKEPGKGTGMGLATVYGIVKQSGGYIWAYSEPDNGASFKIYLPLVDDPVDRARAPAPAQPSRAASETILLVEDEEMVRNMLRASLEAEGYRILEAPGPAEALRLSADHGGPIHLLVTDVVMPGMSGREVAGRLAASRPEMRVLYISGYTDEAIVRHGLLERGVEFLQKPFSPSALRRKVREMFEAAAGRN